MLWLALYIAAMFCIALPVALWGKNPVACIVFVVWCAGQAAYEIGFPEPATQIALYGSAFAYILYERKRGRMKVAVGSLVAATLFVPLLLVCFLWAKGYTSEYDAWWGIWKLAMIQAALLTRPIEWPRAAYHWLSRNTPADIGGNMMVAA